MKKNFLNNKGFAISGIVYTILLLFVVLLSTILLFLINRKVILDKSKNELINELNKEKDISIIFKYKHIILTNTSMINNFKFDLLEDVIFIDNATNTEINKQDVTVTSNPAFDSTKNGIYDITYTLNYNGIQKQEKRLIEVVPPAPIKFYHKKTSQDYSTKLRGKYRIELWGAQGGKSSEANEQNYTGAAGAYTSGDIYFKNNQKLYFYVGEQPINKDNLGGWNGGGNCYKLYPGTGGGGATDVRLKNGDFNNINSLRSRIMVSAGGAGGYELYGAVGGTLSGEYRYDIVTDGKGGTQINGGNGGNSMSLGKCYKDEIKNGIAENGKFGIAGNADYYGTGGGGGYYGGGAGIHVCNRNGGGSGAGGSSYISGHPGCIAIKSDNDSTPIVTKYTKLSDSYHYSNMIFTNTIMKNGREMIPEHDGLGTIHGNIGNGFAKITPLILEKNDI